MLNVREHVVQQQQTVGWLFSGQVLNEGPDPDLNEIMTKAYNNWHIDE